jgi:DNA-binding NtrC family response regulator
MSETALVTVFVVDDESIIALTLSMILNQSGFRARGFLSAEEAIQAAESECPDLLITDVLMPGMNGIDLAIRFESLCPDCKVLLLSGHGNTSNLLDDARLQGHSFQILAKPAHPEDLMTAIMEL